MSEIKNTKIKVHTKFCQKLLELRNRAISHGMKLMSEDEILDEVNPLQFLKFNKMVK